MSGPANPGEARSSALVALARATFATELGGTPEAVALAPGRVNLIGEHTDYNDGFVMPVAIDRHVAVAFRRRGDELVRVFAREPGERRDLAFAGLHPEGRTRSWSDYVGGMLWALRGAGVHVPGLDLAIVADLPAGAGLSSSAALELAVARAAVSAAGVHWEGPAMARLAQRAENEFVGMNCGVMDQFAVACCRAGHALLLDCRSLAFDSVALPDGVVVAVLDTGVRRRLLASEYNDRRAACERAVAALRRRRPGVRALRDASVADVDDLEGAVDAVTLRRARHVVAEIGRPRELAAALGRHDLDAAGALLDASHASLRDLYDVSCPELDLLVTLARAHPACHGARMTGAGFGGCAVALVEAGALDAFAREVAARYRAEGGRGEVLAVEPADGARLVG